MPGIACAAPCISGVEVSSPIPLRQIKAPCVLLIGFAKLNSAFSAELLSAGDASDQEMMIARVNCEVESGSLIAADARQKRVEGSNVPMAVYVDAMSVFVRQSVLLSSKHQWGSHFFVVCN